jgi:hypothetical protein
MGFQENRSDISICNRALSRIYQQPISGSLGDPQNEQKLPARECNRWYKATVRSLLNKHHFGLATKRAALIQKAVNDRSTEWGAAYEVPSDMAFPVSIGPYAASIGQISYYRGINFLMAQLYGKPLFRYEGDTLYSLLADATIDYVSYDITEQDFNQTFEDLVVGFLAAELALPLTKSEKLRQARLDEATNLLNQSIAQSLNLTQPRYGDGLTEAEIARNGGDPRMYAFGAFDR